MKHKDSMKKSRTGEHTEMNDVLLRKLAKDAAGTRKHVPPVWQFYDEELEKFARLIISECANALVDNELYNRHIAAAWREHFGVE